MRPSIRRKIIAATLPLIATPAAALAMTDSASGKIALSILLIISIVSPPIALWRQQRSAVSANKSTRGSYGVELSPRTEVSPNFSGWQGAIKRVIDILISLTVLVLVFPALFLVALAIKIGDQGTVLYRLNCLGRHRQPFTLITFRTHRASSVLNDELSPFTHTGFSFITPVGRFLERFLLHKIPTLLNVLKGDMSLIGPGPQPQRDSYPRTGWATIILEVRPGLASLADIMAGARRKALIREHQILWDIFYINHWSLSMDAKISWWLIKLALLGRGDPPNADSLRTSDENTVGAPEPIV